MAHAFMSMAYVVGGIDTSEKEAYVPMASFMKRDLNIVKYYDPSVLY